jgi:hypothetical protein
MPSKHISDASQHWPLHSVPSPQSLTQTPSEQALLSPQHLAVAPNTQAGTAPQIDAQVPSSAHSSPTGQSQLKSTRPAPPVPIEPNLGAEVGSPPHPSPKTQTSTIHRWARMV